MDTEIHSGMFWGRSSDDIIDGHLVSMQAALIMQMQAEMQQMQNPSLASFGNPDEVHQIFNPVAVDACMSTTFPIPSTTTWVDVDATKSPSFTVPSTYMPTPPPTAFTVPTPYLSTPPSMMGSPVLINSPISPPHLINSVDPSPQNTPTLLDLPLTSCDELSQYLLSIGNDLQLELDSLSPPFSVPSTFPEAADIISVAQSKSSPPCKTISPAAAASDAKHSQSVTDQIPAPSYDCPYCPTVFRRKHDRSRHVRTQHTERHKRHLCGYCGRPFARMDTLRKHIAVEERKMRRLHVGASFHPQGLLSV